MSNAQTLGAVAFDFGGILQRPPQTRRHALVAQHLHLDLRDVERALPSAERALKCGAVDEETFWRQFAADLGGRVDDAAAWANTLAAHYLAPGLNGEVLALAQKLARAGVMTPLCSNTTPARAALNERRGAYAPFWPRLLSCEVGLLKPDPAMYAALVRAVALPPDRILFVDDKPANVAAAEAAGMWGHVYTKMDALLGALRDHNVWQVAA